jgi:hypothetical protein
VRDTMTGRRHGCPNHFVERDPPVYVVARRLFAADRVRLRLEAARENWARLILAWWHGGFAMAAGQRGELIDRDMQYAAAATPKNAGLT